MTNKPESAITIREIASTFRLTGWISFWSQLILTVVSSAILAFAAVSGGRGTNSPGTGIGVVLTVCGILVLGFNMYWAVMSYVRTGRRLNAPNVARPKKAEAIQVIRTGLIASLIGMLFSLIGAEAIVGLLFGKAVQSLAGTVPLGGNYNPFANMIQPIDVLVVQASINVILAQFIAIAASLWLLNKMSRQ